MNDNGSLPDTDYEANALREKLLDACIGYDASTIIGALAATSADMVFEFALPGRMRPLLDEFLDLLKGRFAQIEEKLSR